MKQKIYVHVADDHKIVIEGIIAVINTDKDIEINGYSLTGKEVVDWFSVKENKADVLILDINMPIYDGFEVLTRLRKRHKKQKVIVLSSYDDVKIVEEVLGLGCVGYVSKNNAGEHIVAAIKAVSEGHKYFSSDIQEGLIKKAIKDPFQGKTTDELMFEKLSEREVEVLKMIAREYSSEEISDRLCLSANTVATHRRNLLKKLQVKNSVGLAMYAVKNNII
ncbi:response regulator transcription factor [Polaribacter sp.]|nr:response regulator transcription factor [Polaribacter sp.]